MQNPVVWVTWPDGPRPSAKQVSVGYMVAIVHGWKRVAHLSRKGHVLGLALALLMLVFSSYVYYKTGDWVAAVFVLGSVGYTIFFGSVLRRNGI